MVTNGWIGMPGWLAESQMSTAPVWYGPEVVSRATFHATIDEAQLRVPLMIMSLKSVSVQ